MQAVILAAGTGTRLRPLTEHLPKGLIPVENKALLEYSLDNLRKAGIEEVILVVGFCQELIRQKFGAAYKGMRISYAVNPDFAATGSMYSFSRAGELIKNDVLLLESDLLYESRALEVLLASRHQDVILTAPLSGSGDEVYICVNRDQAVTALGKKLPALQAEAAIGELVGISRFSAQFLEKLFVRAENDYAAGQKNYHYEECVLAASRQSGHPVYALACPGLQWIEIDTENDYRRAREAVYPAIKTAAESV